MIAEPLIFRGADPYYRESVCGNYRIVRVLINGEARFEPWRRKDTFWHPILTGHPALGLLDVETARAVCIHDRDGGLFLHAPA
jgi:hypothetical protein